MTAHILWIAGIGSAIVFGTFLPFLPGSHDPLAMPISGFCLVFGRVALVFVPLGIAWLTYEGFKPSIGRKRYWFGLTTLLVACVLAGVVTLVALAIARFLLGLFVFGVSVSGLLRAWRALTQFPSSESPGLTPIPLYLVLLPLMVFALQSTLAKPATEFGRRRAIQNSDRLIEHVERYRSMNGGYPESLAAVYHDYKPGLMGASHYAYGRAGDSYNLYCELPTLILGTREFLVYNPSDQHLLPGHDSDILLWTPQQLRERRGYYAEHDGPATHWKYFWFD